MTLKQIQSEIRKMKKYARDRHTGEVEFLDPTITAVARDGQHALILEIIYHAEGGEKLVSRLFERGAELYGDNPPKNPIKVY